MTDDELRALVRDAIARHLGGPPQGTPFDSAQGKPVAAAPVPLWRSHPSFGKYIVPSGTDQDGPCLIEPTVHCNHCGFCQSHGH